MTHDILPLPSVGGPPAVAADVAAGRVYVTGDPVVGVLVLVPHEDHLFLESIAVHPDAHGRGVGRRLLEFVDDHARELGLRKSLAHH
jgi:N-acetylglutamate synthase-like GNAT family acetyltransferase